MLCCIYFKWSGASLNHLQFVILHVFVLYIFHMDSFMCSLTLWVTIFNVNSLENERKQFHQKYASNLLTGGVDASHICVTWPLQVSNHHVAHRLTNHCSATSLTALQHTLCSALTYPSAVGPDPVGEGVRSWAKTELKLQKLQKLLLLSWSGATGSIYHPGPHVLILCS